jgi:hypothetical protein
MVANLEQMRFPFSQKKKDDFSFLLKMETMGKTVDRTKSAMSPSS